MTSPNAPTSGALSDRPTQSGSLLERLRDERVRVHAITNAAAQVFTANLLLAAGGIPSLTVAPEEIASFTARSRALNEALTSTGLPLLVNDRVDVALAVGADGVHLGQDNMHPADARRLLGPRAIIGLTVKTTDQADELFRLPVDYACIGGVFATVSKNNPAPPVGLDGLSHIAFRARLAGSLPVGAIAGIDHGNAASVIAAGVGGVAMISALFHGRRRTRRGARSARDRGSVPRRPRSARVTPIAVTIAGSDSGGGAGIQADLKTFSALGVYGASVITALTAQNTRGVPGIHDVPPAFVAQQIDSVFSDLSVSAVKIGMLSQPAVIEAVAAVLDRHKARNVVLDPVMIAASGDRLLAPEAIDTLRRVLIPRALLVTPNLPEAAAIPDEPVARDEAVMQAQAMKILALGLRAILVKGGHAEGDDSADIRVDDSGIRRFVSRRVATRNTHGTGCTLSSAIAAGLAKGLSLQEAVESAKHYISAAIAASDTLTIGSGPGPVHHFHGWWT